MTVCSSRAVDEGFREAVEILAELGQKELLLVKDEDNLTCIGWAVELDHSEIAQVLVEKGLRFVLVGMGEESNKKAKEKEHQRREEELSRRCRPPATNSAHLSAHFCHGLRRAPQHGSSQDVRVAFSGRASLARLPSCAVEPVYWGACAAALKSIRPQSET